MVSDLEISQRILESLAFEPSVDATYIGVLVENGVSTLSGHVATYAEKLQAEEIALRVRGVRALATEIEVRQPDRKQRADDQIASRALDIISWNTALPEGAIHVKVEDGWVTLSGEVPWQFQRAAAEDAVKRLGGVVGVLNLLTIRPFPRAFDIRNRIENALQRNAEIDAEKISVTIDDDKVILEGDVDTLSERGIAERVAWSVPGVGIVENHIRIG